MNHTAWCHDDHYWRASVRALKCCSTITRLWPLCACDLKRGAVKHIKRLLFTFSLLQYSHITLLQTTSAKFQSKSGLCSQNQIRSQDKIENRLCMVWHVCIHVGCFFVFSLWLSLWLNRNVCVCVCVCVCLCVAAGKYNELSAVRRGLHVKAPHQGFPQHSFTPPIRAKTRWYTQTDWSIGVWLHRSSLLLHPSESNRHLKVVPSAELFQA